jgi:solute carrier family 25 uncoupling protein 8/9
MSYTGFRIGLYPTVRTALGRDDLLGRLIAGGITGGVGAVLFAPADVVRIRMQGPTPYGSTLTAFYTVASTEGVLALWKGVSASALRACFLSATQLATYDSSKRVFKDKGLFVEGPGLHITASLLSGFAAQTVVMPFDVLRTVVMSGARASDGGTFATLRALVREGGVRALYRGYLPALARQGPVMVVQMPIVEQLRGLVGLDFF